MKDGKYIAVSVYGDGSESMTPSWIYNHEQQTSQGLSADGIAGRDTFARLAGV